VTFSPYRGSLDDRFTKSIEVEIDSNGWVFLRLNDHVTTLTPTEVANLRYLLDTRDLSAEVGTPADHA